MMGTEVVDVRGRRLNVRVGGAAHRPAVVLLHGLGRSLRDWDEQHERLAEGHRVISLDLPGFGWSEPTSEPLRIHSLAAAIPSVLDKLGETRSVHLVGNSLGGAVAMRLSVLAPERVASLTLVSSTGFGASVIPSLWVAGLPVVGRLLRRRMTPKLALRTERALFCDPDFVTPERVAHAVRIAQWPHRKVAFDDIAQELGSVRVVKRAWREQLLVQMRAAPKPTLVMWGEQDRVLPATHLQTARVQLPHAHTRLFPDTGHLPQIERADEFAELLREHVRIAQPVGG